MASDIRLIKHARLRDYRAKRISGVLRRINAHMIDDKTKANIDERAHATLTGYVAVNQ